MGSLLWGVKKINKNKNKLLYYYIIGLLIYFLNCYEVLAHSEDAPQDPLAQRCVTVWTVNSECVCRGLRSHLTFYRSFRRRFLQVRIPIQQCQSTDESQLANEICFNPTKATPLCYNMNCKQPPLGKAHGKGPSVTKKTQSAGPISCLEHHATRVLHSRLYYST